MSYNYRKPQDVVSPKSRIKGTPQVIYDGKDGEYPFSIAIINWDGNKAYGIRWNVSDSEWDNPEKMIGGTKQCVGNPQSRGNSTWFIVPDILFNPTNPVMQEILKKIK
ncbi:MAG: hypothetical protein RLN88_16200 [Ekhidna sp.]|uniref:hypothetical protein n=1 Tax=Ekhidna sp. TaxID=2608089 RepID=UPI0032EE5F02